MREITIKSTDSDSVFAEAKKLVGNGIFAFQIKDENGKWLFEMNCFNGEYGSLDFIDEYAKDWLSFVKQDENKTLWDAIDAMPIEDRFKLAAEQLTDKELEYAKSCWEDEIGFKECMNETV